MHRTMNIKKKKSEDYSLHFYPSLHISFNNVLQKAVLTQDVTNPIIFPLYCIYSMNFKVWP